VPGAGRWWVRFTRGPRSVNLPGSRDRPNVPAVDRGDPPSPRAVVRGILGRAGLVAGPALGALLAAGRHRRDPARAGTLIAELARRHPDAPELAYVRPR
jgi:hypothetical protein